MSMKISSMIHLSGPPLAMELVMYLLLHLRNTEAAAEYLSILPVLIITLIAGNVLVSMEKGSSEIWIAANCILTLGAAVSCLCKSEDGAPFWKLLIFADIAALLFFSFFSADSLIRRLSTRWLSNRVKDSVRKKVTVWTRRISDYAWILWGIAALFLLYCMLRYGDKRENTETITSIEILGEDVQLTEFVKILAALFYASLLSGSSKRLSVGARLFWSFVFLAGCFCILYKMQELGTALILLVLHVLCIFVFVKTSALKTRLFAAAFILAVFLVLFLLFVYPHLGLESDLIQKVYARFAVWIITDKTDPSKEGFSINQSIQSILLGGLFGNASLSVQLPEAGNDFVYAYIINHLGLVFGILVFGLYMLIAISGLKRVLQLHGFRKVLCFAFSVLFSFQSIYCMAMNCGFLPVCGIPCSLLSRGGMCLGVSMIMIVYIVLVKSDKEVSI